MENKTIPESSSTTKKDSVYIVIVLFIGLNSIFTVDERELALKFRLGEIVETNFTPGLHVKIPFINNVRKFDKRILTIDAKPWHAVACRLMQDDLGKAGR